MGFCEVISYSRQSADSSAPRACTCPHATEYTARRINETTSCAVKNAYGWVPRDVTSCRQQSTDSSAPRACICPPATEKVQLERLHSVSGGSSGGMRGWIPPTIIQQISAHEKYRQSLACLIYTSYQLYGLDNSIFMCIPLCTTVVHNTVCSSSDNIPPLPLDNRLVAWHSGRTSVSDGRTFPVLRSTCS